MVKFTGSTDKGPKSGAGSGISSSPRASKEKSVAEPSSKEKREMEYWFERIRAANEHYEDWQKEFHPDATYKAFKGKQWPEDLQTGDPLTEPLTINLMFSTMASYVPSLYFNRPKYIVKGKPERVDDQLSKVNESALLRQDTLNSYISDKKVNFVQITKLVTLDAMFYFGVSEMCYSTSLIDNPNAGKPVLKPDGQGEYEGVTQPAKLPKEQRFYVKRIPPSTFRFNAKSRPILEENDWCGYFQYRFIEDLKADDTLENTDGIKPGETVDTNDCYADKQVEDWKKYKGPVRVKVWTVVDLRAKEKIVFVEGYHKKLRTEKYKVFPFQFQRHYLDTERWYPMPPTFTWLDPQRELNFSRETQRVHNRKSWRRYLAEKDAIEQNEVNKLVHGGDGIVIWRKAGSAPVALTPIQEPAMDSSVIQSGQNAYLDFTQTSGVPSESRGVAQSATATQAAILNSRMNTLESNAQSNVGDYLGDVGFAWLETMDNFATLPIWIKRNIDPTSPAAPAEAAAVTEAYKRIQNLQTETGGYGYEVSVDVVALSPVSEEKDNQAWMTALTAISNPAIAMLLGLSPYLLGRTLESMNITNGKDVVEIGKALAAMAQAQAGVGQGSPPAAGGGTQGGGSTAGVGGSGPDIASMMGAAAQGA